MAGLDAQVLLSLIEYCMQQRSEQKLLVRPVRGVVEQTVNESNRCRKRQLHMVDRREGEHQVGRRGDPLGKRLEYTNHILE